MGAMRPCYHIEITTPKGVVLNGLWLGAKKPRRAVVWVHGLGSSAFSKLQIMELLADKETAVLSFNNRGHDTISSIHIERSSSTNVRLRKSNIGGAAHERFTDCLDDIDGAVQFSKKAGAKQIFLAGHSTGCQKSVYWAAKRDSAGVAGIILLAPISDYTIRVAPEVREKALAAARELIKAKMPHELLPSDAWNTTIDAQRFLSLYSGESAEEIFPYWSTAKKPRMLERVTKPVLVLLAVNDEYVDRPAQEIEAWFAEHLKIGDKIAIVPETGHGFGGAERAVARLIRKYMVESRR